MSFFPSGFGAHLAFQHGFVNTEKSTLALESMEELETVCSLGDNFYSAFRVGERVKLHTDPSPKNTALNRTVSLCYSIQPEKTPRNSTASSTHACERFSSKEARLVFRAQLQNQRSRGSGYQISYPGFKRENKKKGLKARGQWQVCLNDFNADISQSGIITSLPVSGLPWL